MSYCVNCGVELDATSSACPLCQTKVYNPNQPAATDIPTPYPKLHGESEPDHNLEFTILMTIIFLTTAGVCGLLNVLVFPIGKWSLYIIGICVLLWIFMIPIFFPNKANTFLCLALDCIGIALYAGFVSLLHPGNGWYVYIVLPIIGVVLILAETYLWLTTRKKLSHIIHAMIIFADIAIDSSVIEVVFRAYFDHHIRLTWAAVVLTCCVLIDIVLFTISKQKRLRKEFQRRMHF